jgi:hypothetical protein
MTRDGMDIHMVAPLGVEGRVRYLTCVMSMAVAWVGILPRQGVLAHSTIFVVFFFLLKF